MSSGQVESVIGAVSRMLEGQTAETDRALMERFAARGDGEAFRLLIERHGPMVFGVCRRLLLQTQDAEDAFQAVFLLLARKGHGIRPNESFGPWLYGVAIRLARRLRSAIMQRQRREKSLSTEDVPGPCGETLAGNDLRTVLDEELRRLPAKFRSPMILCYLEGKTNAEAAAELGKTKGTVSGWLARGREMLRKRLARRGITLSALALGEALTPRGMSAPVPPMLSAGTLRVVCGEANASAVAIALAERVLPMEGGRGLVYFALLCAGLLVVGAGVWATTRPNRESRRTDEPGRPSEPDPTKRPKVWGPAREMNIGVGQQIHAVTIHPDGKSVATATADGKVRLWDAETGKLHDEPIAFVSPALALHISRDGKSLTAVGAPNEVVVWDLSRRRQIRAFKLGEVFLTSAVISEDGSTLAGCSSAFLAGVAGFGQSRDKIRLWDLLNGKTLCGFPGHALIDMQLCLLADRKTLLTAGSRPRLQGDRGKGTPLGVVMLEIKRWDMKTGRASMLEEGGLSLASTHDGKKIAFGTYDEQTQETAIVLWDVAGERRIGSLGPTGNSVNLLAFNPDGRLLAAGGNEGVVNVWDTTTFKRVVRLEGHKMALSALTFSEDGEAIASADWAGVVRLWSTRTPSSDTPGR